MSPTETAVLLEQWFEAAPIARVLVAQDLTLLSSNPAADLFLREGDAIVARNGLLAAADRDAHAILAMLVALGGRGRPVVLPSTGHEAPIVVHGQALREGLILLELRRARPLDEAAVPDLSQIFRLTRGEKALVGPLMEGKSNDDIARDLGVSIETVRTHLKNACAKLGVSGRAEFVAKLIQFLPT